METTKKLLGLRIKELRKSQNLSQFQLAEIIEKDSKHLSRIENGGSYPSIDTLEKIAIALKTDLKDFFNFEHLQSKKSLVKELTKTIDTVEESKLQLLYKLFLAITK